MGTFYIDYETHWGTKYSLRTAGMSYTDFILDERFELLGASIAIDDSPIVWYPKEKLYEFMSDLKQSGDYKDWDFVAHNVPFDGFITHHVFDMHFKRYFCTLAAIDAQFQGAMGRGLDEAMTVLLGRSGKSDIVRKIKDLKAEDLTDEHWEELEKYADEDLRATRDLYKLLAYRLPALEREIMDTILKMFVEPKLVFDADMLYAAVQEADRDREIRISAAEGYGASEEILRGNKTFPDFLIKEGIRVPMKPSPTNPDTNIPALAKTDKGFQKMLESEDEKTRALAEGRLAVKSTQAQTRAYRFKFLHEELGYCPVLYNYARAHTWRLSGGNKINMANLKRGSKLRLSVQAPVGQRMVVVDASQIECRKTAWLAGQEDLLELFRQGQDPYDDMASEIFGRRIDRKGNPEDFFEGFVGKTATLGLGFGMGGKKFADTVRTGAKTYLGLDVNYTDEEGYRVVNLYRSKNYKIRELWRDCERMLFAMANNECFDYPIDGGQIIEVAGKENKIYFPNGTWLYYPNLEWTHDGFKYYNKQGSKYISKYIYGGLLCENIVQHMSRNITSDHMVQINKYYPVVMHTYDENIALAPDEEADDALALMLKIMETPPWWCKSMPLAAEGGHAREYSK